jgi:lysozyme
MNKEEELMVGCEWLEKFEGYESKIYMDTEGIDTVGIGRNLEVYPFDDEEAAEYELHGYTHLEAIAWAHTKLMQCRKDIIIHNPWVLEQPEDVRLILTDMVYNLGLRGTLGFKRMLRAIKAQDYAQAAAELEDSKYFHQTGQRSLHHYRLLLKCGTSES